MIAKEAEAREKLKATIGDGVGVTLLVSTGQTLVTLKGHRRL
jgi:hypothetical protein